MMRISFALCAAALFVAAEQAPKITSIVTKQGNPAAADSIAEAEVHDSDVVTCASADDESGTDAGVCHLELPSGHTTMKPKQSVTLRGSGHLKLTCGKKGQRVCHALIVTGYPKGTH